MENELKKKIDEFGLSKYSQKLLEYAKNSIRLYTETAEEDDIGLGSTKIGGRPDVPPNFNWPLWSSRPLSFIAQINLSEVSKYDAEGVLPESGILYFFYDSDQAPWGFDPEEAGSWRVFYYDGNLAKLTRIEFPEDLEEGAIYEPCKVTISSELNLAPLRSIPIKNLRLSDEEKYRYSDLVQSLGGETGTVIHKLLGYPDEIQGDMEETCQFASNGIYCGDETYLNDPKIKKLEKGITDWMLLLQIDSDEENAGMMWEDVGRLYYWIRKEDLINKDFDKVWIILQCY